MGEPKGPIVLICGINPDGTLRTLEVDASDYLKVAVEAFGHGTLDVDVVGSVLPTGASTSAKQTTLATELVQKLETADLELVSKILSSGPHGWIGGAWQRSPIPFGYSAIVEEALSTTLNSGGAADINGAIVPAGEIWVVTICEVFNNDGATSTTQIIGTGLAGGITFGYELNLAQKVRLLWNGFCVLQEGDRFAASWRGGSENDSVRLHYAGYRIDIDQ